MIATLEGTWKVKLEDLVNSSFHQEMICSLDKEYDDYRCYPAKNEVFKAFELCSFESVKVVIIGQDPYIRNGQAHGLSFSVPQGMAIPPSLKNIFKELKSDIGSMPISGDLTFWAKQGVLLLNATLTVREGLSNSHSSLGWLDFTKEVLHVLNNTKSNVVYMAWGGFAQKLCAKINTEKNLVLKAPHPSPLSSYRGFFGSKHFSAANKYLISQKIEPIKWCK